MKYYRHTILPYYDFFFYALATVSVLVSIIVDLYTHRRYTLFERSGAVMVFCGTFLSFRYQFRRGIIGIERDKKLEIGTKVVSASEDATQKEEQGKREKMQAERDIASLYYGTIIAAVGTIIWGYGDLLLQ